ncbi:MAG: putative ABC transporter permease [Lachnospirales bacterium]
MYTLNYNVLTFFMIFYIYCFLGWCFESTYVSIKSKKWVNRGFMKGPFLPIYGVGAVIILFATVPAMSNPFLVYVLSVISATVLEYCTGIVMEKLFKVRYWDYSKNFLNYKGYICLKSSITWGFMGILITYIVNEPVARFIDSLSNVIILIVVVILTVFFVVDFVQSFKAAYNLREIIMNNEKLMKELKELKINIAVAIGEADNMKDEIMSGIREKIETARSYTEIDDYILSKFEELKNLEIGECISNWKEKTDLLKKRIESVDRNKIAILKRNPNAKSNLGFVREVLAFYKKK